MFDNFEKTILSMQTDVNMIKMLLLLMLDNLKTRNNVAKFLSVSTKTIDNWIEKGILKKDYHYIINENNRKEFIAEKIIELKKNKITQQKEKQNIQKQLNPISKKFLKNRKIA